MESLQEKVLETNSKRRKITMKDWFNAYSDQIRAIIDAIYAFVLGIFNKEVPEAEDAWNKYFGE